MRKPNKKTIGKAVLFLLVCGLLAVAFWLANRDNAELQAQSGAEFSHAVVQRVAADSSELDSQTGLRLGEQEVELKITDGPYKDELHTVTNQLSLLYNVYLRPGDRVIVSVYPQDNGSYTVSVYNYDRTWVLGGCAVAFLALLCIVGRKKGAKAILGLVFTLACVVLLLIPLVLKGWPPVPVALGIVLLSSSVSFLLLDGITVKAASAMLGTVAGVAAAGLFSGVAAALAHLGGFNMPEAESLLLVAGGSSANISGLLVAGILIASLGAVMDVAMSISSAVHELRAVNPELPFSRLFRSGMHIGRDAMGTMANTLILAFAGSSLNLLLLVFSYGIPFNQFINNDAIAIEVIRGIAGSVGIVASVPIAACIAAILHRRKAAGIQ